MKPALYPIYNPRATPYDGNVWTLAKNHLGTLSVAVRTDFCYAAISTQTLHRITPAGYIIFTPTYVTENPTNVPGRTFGILDGVSSQGGKVGFAQGDTAYDEDNNPWDGYVVGATYLFGCWVKRE